MDVGVIVGVALGVALVGVLVGVCVLVAVGVLVDVAVAVGPGVQIINSYNRSERTFPCHSEERVGSQVSPYPPPPLTCGASNELTTDPSGVST